MSDVKVVNSSNEQLILSISGRVDSNNAAECENDIFALIEGEPNKNISIDLEGLEYISSAGLRVLMKLAKQTKEKVRLFNVSRDIFDIFEMTGFVELFDIAKKRRKISVEGCEVIGRGANGVVYRLDADTVIKVYQPGTPISDVQRERDLAQNAFLKGIPTAISYDVVDVDDCLGIVFEMLNAKSLSSVIDENPAMFDELARKYVDTYKTFHDIHDAKGEFPRAKDIYNSYIDGCIDWYTKEEVQTLRDIVDAIPERDTLIHGDYHAHNIMYIDGELIMIDMGDVSVGHPIFDFLSTASTQANLVDLNPDYATIHTGMSVENIKNLWNTLLHLYFAGKSAEEIDALDKQIRLISKLKVAFAPVIARGIPEELIRSSVDDAKANLIPKADEIIGKINW